MTAYLDSSFLLAIAFGEPGGATLQRILGRHDRVLSADLIVAECLSSIHRESLDDDSVMALLHGVDFVFPPRSLAREMREALDVGHLRGAGLWHVACTMYLASTTRADVAFLSRDQTQRRVARRLGFATP